MRKYWFSIRKRGFFRPGKEIKGVRRGVHQYAAQVTPQIDAARAENDRFRMKTKYRPWKIVSFHAFIDEAKAADFERYLKSGSGRAFANKRLW